MLVIATTTSSLIAGHSVAAESTRSQQWYLDAMQADEIWKTAEGDGVVVAVVDTGVDDSVPELKGRVLEGRSFIEGRDAHRDAHGHGTSMASLIAGSGAGNGIKGLAPKSKILPISISTVDFRGDMKKDLPKAIEYAIESGAKIINMSFGSVADEEDAKQIQPALNKAYRSGVLIFAGSGNWGDKSNNTFYPAALPGVVAVGASDKEGKPAKFSSHGQHLTLSAPGTDMPMRCEAELVLCRKDGGTSAATALTSASAALIWSKHPDWTNNQVLRTMIETAGRVDADKNTPPNVYGGYGAVRPRMVLVEGEADPGDPEKHPTFSKYYEQLEKDDDKQTPTPSGPPADGKNENAGAEKAGSRDDATATSEEGTGMPLVLGGAGAIALAAVAGTVFLVRRRNSASH